MTYKYCLSLVLLTGAISCGDVAMAPDLPSDPSLAKGAPPAAKDVDFTITDAGLSLVSDGKGTYLDGVCGVGGSFADLLFLSPAGEKIPKSQQASCAGIAPRRATVTLALKHISDDPHVDDNQSQGGGVFDVGNVKFGFGEALATTINATSSAGFCGTAGLRYTPISWPGSDFTVRDDLGNGLWHLYTRPWPDNKASCENNGVVVIWHVSFDIYAQVKP